MKLSLWMIAERLRKYDVRAIVKDGSSSIVGVRFINEQVGDLSQEHVYISRASFVSGDIEDGDKEVVLIHKNDVLLVSGGDAETVLNEVLNAFDYYNYWETRLWKAATDPDPFQRIAELGAEVLSNPICINDCEGNVLALNRDFGPDDVDDRWRELYRTGIVPISCTSPPILTIDNELVEDWSEKPAVYQYSDGTKYICAKIFSDDEQLAIIYIQQHGTEFTSAHCQLTQVICKVLSSLLSSMRHATVFSSASALASLLSGKELQASAINRLVGRRSWTPPWNLLVIRNYPASSSRTKQQNLLHNIRQFDLETISLIYDGNVVVVTDRATIPAFLDAMSAAANMHYYSIGISLPFYSWNDLPFQYRQSLFSIEENRGKSGVFDSKDHAFPYLISSIQEENRELGLCHPALIILKEYDDEHQTELFATLFKYVSLERNLVKTSEALHIHRNSLVYRINRIKKLVGSDFDDPEERAFLLLSFYLFPAGDHEVLSV